MDNYIKIKHTPVPKKYLFQNIIRFKSPTRVFANEVEHHLEVRQLSFSESGSTYEIKTTKRKQSYHKELEAITPILYEKIHPVFKVKTDATGQIVQFLNYEDIVYNWSKHKKKLVQKLEKNWLTLNTIKSIEALMFDREAFRETFARKPEMKLLFPDLYNMNYELDKKYIRSEPCDELATNIDIPLSVAYWLNDGIDKTPVFRFQGKLNQDEFQTKKQGEKETEEQKLMKLVRTFKSNNTAKFSPLIKQTGFFNLDNTASVAKGLEAISFKIPAFVYQDRITSLTVKN